MIVINSWPGLRAILSSGSSNITIDHDLDNVAVDQLAASSSGLSQGEGGDTVEVAMMASAGLMHQRQGVDRKDLVGTAGKCDPMTDIVAGVIDGQRLYTQSAVYARQEGPLCSEAQSILKFGQAHKHYRQQRSRVPFVVQQDMQMSQNVVMQHMGFVKNQYGMLLASCKISNVGGDSEEQCCGGCLGGDAQGKTKLSVEITPAKRWIVAVGQPKALTRQFLA